MDYTNFATKVRNANVEATEWTEYRFRDVEECRRWWEAGAVNAFHVATTGAEPEQLGTGGHGIPKQGRCAMTESLVVCKITKSTS